MLARVIGAIHVQHNVFSLSWALQGQNYAALWLMRFWERSNQPGHLQIWLVRNVIYRSEDIERSLPHIPHLLDNWSTMFTGKFIWPAIECTYGLGRILPQITSPLDHQAFTHPRLKVVWHNNYCLIWRIKKARWHMLGRLVSLLCIHWLRLAILVLSKCFDTSTDYSTSIFHTKM